MVLIVAVVITSVVLFLSWWFFTYYTFSRHLRGFPNPPRFLFFGNALELKSTTDFIPAFAKYKKLYGGAVKLYLGLIPNNLVIFDYKFIEYILSSTHILDKGSEYQYFARWLGRGLLISNGDSRWKKHRKVIGPSFHRQIYEDFIQVFESNTHILIDKLKTELGNLSFDIYPYIRLCSLDIICEAAMGSSIHAQRDVDSEYVKSVKTMCQLFMIRAFHPLLRNECIYKFSKEYQKELEALKIINNYTNEVIEKRRKHFLRQDEDTADDTDSNKKLALLDLLLQESEINKTLSYSDIKEEVETFLFAGHDTSTSAISFTIFTLAQNPKVQDAVVQELLKIFADDITRPVTLQDVNQMKYLEAVIKESLRLFPPVPYVSRQVREDVEYNGNILPKGLTLLLDIYGLHHDPELHSEPEKFVPERFLDESSGKRLPYAYLPFSSGPRNCIGQKFAMLEMKSLLSILLRRFELLPSVPHHNLILSTEVVMQSKNGLRIQIKERVI